MAGKEPAVTTHPSSQRRPIAAVHAVLGGPLKGPWPPQSQRLYLAMGCFWGAERIFWHLPGVLSTAVGYMAGQTPNPTYEQACTGSTGHAETVQVVFDPHRISLEVLLKAFWENHDPTQGNRQGNDIGTQYRSAVYWSEPEHEALVRMSRDAFNEVTTGTLGTITTQLLPAEQAGPFYYAEDYHQQYLHKNPGGYCNHGPNGCQMPTLSAARPKSV
ncbi:MAG: peptide-methionine (S)-S-oxide reductase MsrA [Beutenbergiaceae bacterium]